MYAVIKVDLKQKKEEFKPTIYKGFKSLKPALKLAIKRNNMISTCIYNYKYLVWDYKNKKVYEHNYKYY